MDLTTARDHPNVILNRYAAEAYKNGDDSRGTAYSISVTRLLSYELENGVTFAALDNEALEDVKNALALSRENPDLSGALGQAINALLGLEDE